MEIAKYNELGKKLEEELLLRYAPIALKVHYEGDELPADTIRPLRDQGKHYAMCQAFAAVRRQRVALTMLKEDHWCVWPLVSYGMVELEEPDYETMGTKLFVSDPRKGVEFFRTKYPRLAKKGAIGFSIAPLSTCSFEPDLVCVYCRPAQIRTLLMVPKLNTGELLDISLDPVDSCVHSTIPVLNGKDYNVTFPDPGEYERGLTDEDEVMFTFRAEKLPEVLGTLEAVRPMGLGYRQLRMELATDFGRPQFYMDMFEKWGLPRGELWDK